MLGVTCQLFITELLCCAIGKYCMKCLPPLFENNLLQQQCLNYGDDWPMAKLSQSHAKGLKDMTDHIKIV